MTVAVRVRDDGERAARAENSQDRGAVDEDGRRDCADASWMPSTASDWRRQVVVDLVVGEPVR